MKFNTLVLTYPNGTKGYYPVDKIETVSKKVVRIYYRNTRTNIKYCYSDGNFYRYKENELHYWHKNWTGWVPNKIYPVSAVIIPAHYLNVMTGYYSVPKEDIINVF